MSAPVFSRLVGQEHVEEVLSTAVAGAADSLTGGPGHGMTHAWLFTGPPGSGRSTAARAFAAALQCPSGGCGTCPSCHTVFVGTHPDVEVVATEALSISVDDARALVRESAMAPTQGRWRVILVEDADRLTEQASNALLKVLEEPTRHTVWMLCAPSYEDVLPTIRSRARHVQLVTPSVRAVADHLVAREGVDRAMASFAARASQGHIGRARGLATDEATRLRRAEVLRIPTQVRDLGAALVAAQNLVDAAQESADAVADSRNPREADDLARGLGVERGRAMPTWARTQLKDLAKAQKKRETRLLRDGIDRALVDLASFYRDVLAVQLGAGVPLVNDELRSDIERMAATATPEETLRRLEAVLEARDHIDTNVAPLLAVESMTIDLRLG